MDEKEKKTKKKWTIEDQRKYDKKYKDSQMTLIQFRLSNVRDAALIKFLKAQKNKPKLLRELLHERLNELEDFY